MAKGKHSTAAASPAAPLLPRKSKSSSRSTSMLTRTLVLLVTGCVVSYIASMYLRDFHIETAARTIQTTVLDAGRYDVACQDDYSSGKGMGSKAGCAPRSCARVLVDDFLSAKEVALLRSMGDLGMSFGEGLGGPTIFDVVSGAASKGTGFVDAYKAMEQRHRSHRLLATGPPPPPLFTPAQLATYKLTTSRVKQRIEDELGVRGLHLASPSFFSRITSAPAKTQHDEYDHPHIDRKQYDGFVFTALIYLSEAGDGKDFMGGEFVFIDSNGTDAKRTETEVGRGAADTRSSTRESHVLPHPGRMMFFTSGSENVHRVNPVLGGVRRALTIAFTCDPSKSVEAGLLKRAEEMIEEYGV